MANAIHKTNPGDTLVTISKQYYALDGPHGTMRDVDLKKVTNAIRDATLVPLNDFKDIDELPPGTTLFIPTLRELNRVVFSDHPALLSSLKTHGYDHARKLLRYTPDQVVEYLSPLPPDYTADDIKRVCMLTALLNRDGMDRYTAQYLYDTEQITSMQELAGQSPATIDSVLQTLIAPPHSRPQELATQDHAKRWIVSAKIQVRNRIGELTKIKGRFFQVPFKPSTATRQAEFYDAAAVDSSRTRDEASLASRLSNLYRFQAAVLRGSVGLRSGNWAEAIAGYREARRQWHRLAEDMGAVTAVNDEDGLNLTTCVEVTKRLSAALPGEEDAPLGAPGMKLRRGGGRAQYRLRAFRYDELAPNRKQELLVSLSGLRIHQLPRKFRLAVHRAILGKTRRELKTADADLIKGLVSGADTALARDFDAKDRELLQRNVGASTVSSLYGGKLGLDLFESLGADLAIGDVSSILPACLPACLPGLWDAAVPGSNQISKEPVANALSDEAKAKYPADFINRKDVTPFTKFLVLPGENGRSSGRFLPLTAAFTEDYENELLKPRLMSSQGEDLLFDENVWTSAGVFAAIAPYLYATQIPLGLRRAYGQTGQISLARQFGGQRVNIYKADGTLVRDVATADPSTLVFDPDLVACSTGWEPSWEPGVGFMHDVYNYALEWIPLADYEYRQDRRETARSYYADVQCALEQVFPEFADEARLAVTGVYNTIQSVNAGTFVGSASTRNLAKLTTLNVQYTTVDGVTHQVMEDTFLVVKTPQERTTNSLSTATTTLSQYFKWNGFEDIESGELTTGQEIAEDNFDEDTLGESVQAGEVEIFVENGGTIALIGYPELYTLHLYCEARITAIDAGLNWYGYTDEFVPPWPFEHLYGVARDLCNRALEAEQRVFSLLQMYETAAEQEFLAAQQAELAGAQTAVAEAQIVQQVASNSLAMAQAELTQQQAAAQAKKSGTWANVAIVTTAVVGAVAAAGAVVLSEGAAVPAIVAAAPAVAGGIVGVAGNISGHNQDVKVLNEAVEVTAATLVSSVAALSVAIAERDVAALQAEQAGAYVTFLLSEDLTSDAYLHLMGLAKEILGLYLHHANRMAWLAERALEHETRQAYDLIRLDYTINDELIDMTRAQQITGDLETLRSEYVAGQTVRLQEIKWTIALSQIDPIAWQDLRKTGTCTFMLRQRMLDMYFPGMSQHRLKDVRMEIVGLVPPEGARGLFTNPGVSWVRVPNEQSFLSGQVTDDWVTESLANSTTYPQYDQYVLKRLLTSVVTLALSQFDVRGDRAVLSSPQGMLEPVEHQGFNAAWTLMLHRQSNNFDFKNIVEVEFTFWFLCAYDPGLEQAQENALSEEGLQGKLVSAARTAFAIHQPDAWAAFVGEPADPEALDLRYLTLDVQNLPLWEKERKLTNILLGCARAVSQTNEISLRLCCQYDPVGFLLTTKDGAIYSLIGIDTSAEEPPPEPDAAFEAWVWETFYFPILDPDLPFPSPPGTSPPPNVDDGPRFAFRNPEARWVIKAGPAQIGRGWLKEDEDGNNVSTSSGPLQGWTNGTATYRDGARWTNYSFQAKVAHRNGTLRLCIRDDGINHYALQISPTNLKLFKVLNGADTQLGITLPYAYPSQEYLSVDVRVVSDVLLVAVDGLTLFSNINGTPAAGELRQGTVALHVLTTNAAEPVVCDDVKVVRLTGKGAEAETLLSDPFTAQLPSDWTFVDGESPWAISPKGHKLLDLSSLLNVVLSLDYIYQMELN